MSVKKIQHTRFRVKSISGLSFRFFAGGGILFKSLEMTSSTLFVHNIYKFCSDRLIRSIPVKFDVFFCQNDVLSLLTVLLFSGRQLR